MANILLIAQQWAPESGVPQRRGRWMVDQLIEAGHRVSVVAPPPHYPEGHLLSDAPKDQPGSASRQGRCEVLYRSRFFPHTQSIYSRVIDQGVVSITSVATALRASRDAKPDVILATAPPLPAAFTAFIVSQITRTPYVLDLRDAWPELVDYIAGADPTASGVKATIKRALQPAFGIAGRAFGAVLNRADGVLTTSEWHARKLETKRDNPTVVVSNLPLVNLAPPDNDDETPHQRQTQLNVLYTGTVGRAQGLDNAVRACRIANERGFNVKLRIVGDGAHLNRVRRLAEPLGDLVECTGRVPREKVAEFYRDADTILVHLQDWQPLEMAVPSKVFEAIATNKHVTGALDGEGADIIERAKAGDTVPAMQPEALADLWCELARDRERLNINAHGIDWLNQELERTRPSQTFTRFIERISNAS